MGIHNHPRTRNQAPWNIADPGTGKALPNDRTGTVNIVTGSSGETNTLANPIRSGVELTLNFLTDGGGDRVITVASAYNDAGDTTITLATAGQFVHLQSRKFGSGYRWRATTENVLSGVTAGTSAASKALVLDSNSELNDIGVLQSVDVIIATAAVLTLNTTPVSLVAAPGAGVYIEFVAAYVFLDYAGTAYAADAGEDFCIKYTDASGDIVSTSIDGEEFEAAADALYILTPVPTAPNVITHGANAALVAHVLVGNWATGTSPLKIRTLYRLVRAASLIAIA